MTRPAYNRRGVEASAQDEVTSVLTEAFSKLSDTDLDAIGDAIANGTDPVEILDLYGLYDTLVTSLPAALLGPLAHAGSLAFEEVKVGRLGAIRTGFNLTDRRALVYAQDRSAALVTAVDHETRLNVQRSIGRAFSDGIPIPATARAIREVVGLTPQWATAVYNFQAGLIADGAEDAYTNRAVARYASHLRKVRSETIARTEVMEASGAGRAQGWDQAAEAGLFDRATATKSWQAEKNACEWCQAAEDQGPISLDEVWVFRTEAHAMNPLHPRCKCTARLNIDDGGPEGAQ